jgi:plasmid stabilization system protein ParE
MVYLFGYTRLAQMEVDEAYHWYSQVDIAMGDAFLADLTRTKRFIEANPFLYQRVEGEMRRATFKRFPYCLFYVIKNDRVIVQSCFHQSRNPKTRAQLVQ